MNALDSKRVSAPSGPRAFVSAGALVLIGTMAMNLCGFVFHAIASRRLGVADYGSLYALISLVTLVIMPATVLAPVAARYAAEFGAVQDDSHVRGLIAFVVRLFGYIGLGFIAAGLVFAVPLARYLQIPSWEVPVVGVVAAASILSTMLRAIAQGAHKYESFAVSAVAEGVLKLVAVGALGFIGLTVFGAIGSFLVGVAGGLALIALPLARHYIRVSKREIVWDWRRILATTIGAGAIAFTTGTIGTVDVLVVKHAFGAHDAGLYSAAALGGKILLYFVGFIPAVLIPQATARHARGERTRYALGLGLAFIAVVGVFGVLAYRFGGLLLLHALYGRDFDAALGLLPGYGAVMALLAGTNALASYGIATHRLSFVWPLVLATVGTILTFVLYHPTLQIVVDELIAGNAVIFAVVSLALAVQGLRRAHSV